MPAEQRIVTFICPQERACLFIVKQGNELFYYDGMAEHADVLGRYWAPCFSVGFFVSAEAAEQAARQEISRLGRWPGVA